MKAGVYLIVVKPTGESYVGSSINLKKRLAVHRSIMRRTYKDGAVPVTQSGALYNSATEYNPDKEIEFYILEELTPNGDVLAEREKYWYDRIRPSLNRRLIYRRDQSTASKG